MNTVDPQEIQNFSKDAGAWWDETGPFAPLHRLNPVRLKYIKDQACARFDRDVRGFQPFKGLSVLDIGCGGGLVCEPMARMGAQVTGIDADETAIVTAQAHAKDMGLKIDYRAVTTTDLKNKFDIVLALEVAEHVSDVDVFIRDIVGLCKPGGLIVMSTLNRTAKSFALGIVAAEYILRWVPRGTHNWKKFIKPSELARALRQEGAEPQDITGLIYKPLSQDFALSKTDTDVNYMISAVKTDL